MATVSMPFFFLFFVFLLALPVVAPEVDLFLSGLFYRAGDGFFLADNPILDFAHRTATIGSRVLAVIFVVVPLILLFRTRKVRKKGEGLFSAKAWVFLLLALVIGPGLVANVGFKDHWGRARPREIVEFGGSRAFSPALSPRFENKRSNGSFVCGDGAFGFFLPCFGYGVSRKSARRVFWAGMGGGFVFSFVRLAVGAHFFSDIVYAAFFMLLTGALIHAAMFGVSETNARWRSFFSGS